MAHTMSIPDFVRNGWREETPINAFLAHLDRNKIKYRVIGTAIILFLGFADAAFASTGIDVGAKRLYVRLIGVGKWVIIVKGGIDTIKAVAEGDFQAGKKNFLGYVLTYAILWALPWAFDEVEKLFTEMEASAQ
ncbi:hypothetical protein [Paenibacillus planticolens]|uniref:Uncharacterized protein n=1 Tax=Paenibacillus planticolens TaxID=2654976 RepID=A0ABX1ZHA2_9BACL|nr:hypothetical protein [Paenibacillus planticolens]NOU98414.1 hypothetical protein [Paenibacillus planticolens]